MASCNCWSWCRADLVLIAAAECVFRGATGWRGGVVRASLRRAPRLRRCQQCEWPSHVGVRLDSETAAVLGPIIGVFRAVRLKATARPELNLRARAFDSECVRYRLERLVRAATTRPTSAFLCGEVSDGRASARRVRVAHGLDPRASVRTARGVNVKTLASPIVAGREYPVMAQSRRLTTYRRVMRVLDVWISLRLPVFCVTWRSLRWIDSNRFSATNLDPARSRAEIKLQERVVSSLTLAGLHALDATQLVMSTTLEQVSGARPVTVFRTLFGEDPPVKRVLGTRLGSIRRGR